MAKIKIQRGHLPHQSVQKKADVARSAFLKKRETKRAEAQGRRRSSRWESNDHHPDPNRRYQSAPPLHGHQAPHYRNIIPDPDAVWLERNGQRFVSGGGDGTLWVPACGRPAAVYQPEGAWSPAKGYGNTFYLKFVQCRDCLMMTDWGMDNGLLTLMDNGELIDAEPDEPERKKLRKEWRRLAKSVKEEVDNT